MNRMPIPQEENPLWISWHDTNWIPILNPTNVMDYFQEKSNPFYDRTCNNEVIKMQRVGIEQLNTMTGREYILLHVQEPILYVIRKQHRHSVNEVTPMADYYIIAGTVYQAPDLANVFNSRLLSVTQHLQSSFEETSGYSRYHPNKGYSWDFSSNKALAEKTKAQKKDNEKTKEEPSSFFQRKRVDMLLGELLNKFPLPMPPQQNAQQRADGTQSTTTAAASSATAQSNSASAGNTTTAAATAQTTTTPATASSPNVPNGVSSSLTSGSAQNSTGAADDGTPHHGIEIKQERMEQSPDGSGHHSSGDNGEHIKMEPSDMKPPPEKKTKLM